MFSIHRLNPVKWLNSRSMLHYISYQSMIVMSMDVQRGITCCYLSNLHALPSTDYVLLAVDYWLFFETDVRRRGDKDVDFVTTYFVDCVPVHILWEELHIHNGSGTMAMANISPLWWRQKIHLEKMCTATNRGGPFPVTHKPTLLQVSIPQCIIK